MSLGICAALRDRGLWVQPFKKGPDYIDPSWLSAAAGAPCRSLDPYFYPSLTDLRAAFVHGSVQADFCLVEGNHGLYDSSLTADGLDDGGGSTAAVARVLQAPILLVLNTTRMSRSAAAMVQGYQQFEPDTPVAGVVLNQVAHSRHEQKLRAAIEHYTDLPVVGALPRQTELQIPDRHLGLIPISEDPSLHPAILACRQAAERYLNLEQILTIARSAPPLARPEPLPKNTHPAHNVTIGIIRDRAFNFYYPENLEALEQAGANLVFLNALSDAGLPGVDGLMIGGGFPEMFLDELEGNSSFRHELLQAIEAGLPVYAECGGLMYLSKAITFGSRRAEMVGALPFEVEMQARPQGHGYATAEVIAPNPFFPAGSRLRGHEFHHSRLLKSPARSQQDAYPAYRLLPRFGPQRKPNLGGAPGWPGIPEYPGQLHSPAYCRLTRVGARPGAASAGLCSQARGSQMTPTDPFTSQSQLVLVGVNHKFAPIEIRERLAWNTEHCSEALNEIVARMADPCSCSGAPLAAEAVLISTCNRTEIYVFCHDRCRAKTSLKQFLAEHAGLAMEAIDQLAYTECNQAAALHLMLVTAGLDSLVKGENEILGQIKQASLIAQQARTSGPLLSALFRFAIQAGKEVRSQTEIGRTGHSVATVVVELAQDTLGPLDQHTALLLGAGKISAMAARELVRAGLRCVLVANRTYERAQKLAANLGAAHASAIHFNALAESLVEADIVICSTGAPHTVLHTDMVRQAMQQRPNRSLLVADLAVPRDADPEIGSLPGVVLADIDDLETLAHDRHPLTAACLEIAREICSRTAREYWDWLAVRQRVPIIQALRSKANRICDQEVEHTLRRLSPELDADQQQAIRVMAQAIVKKLLHEPINAIKDPPFEVTPDAYLEWVQTFYGLQAPESSA